MKQLTLVSHPLIDHSLTILRDKRKSTAKFRRMDGGVAENLR